MTSIGSINALSILYSIIVWGMFQGALCEDAVRLHLNVDRIGDVRQINYTAKFVAHSGETKSFLLKRENDFLIAEIIARTKGEIFVYPSVNGTLGNDILFFAEIGPPQSRTHLVEGRLSVYEKSLIIKFDRADLAATLIDPVRLKNKKTGIFSNLKLSTQTQFGKVAYNRQGRVSHSGELTFQISNLPPANYTLELMLKDFETNSVHVFTKSISLNIDQIRKPQPITIEFANTDLEK